MAGLGLGAGYGAGAMSGTLGDILKQKFLEQIQKQKLAEDIRQANLQHEFQSAQLGQNQQRIGLEGQKLGEDRRQFDIGSGQAQQRIGLDTQKFGLEQEAQPVRLKYQQAQADELARKPVAEQEERSFITGRDTAQGAQRMKEIGASGANSLAVAREGTSRERAADWQIVDTPTGGKVRVNRITGEEVPLAQAGKAGAGAGGKGAVSEEYAKERQRRIVQSVDEMMNQTDWTTVGPAAYASGVPGTPALAFKKQMETLHSNIAFGELAEMRAASKTGGALGQVSDKEGTLLQSTLGALDQKMSPEQFKGQLAKIKQTLATWNAAKAADAAAKKSTGGLGVTTAGGSETPDQRLARLKAIAEGSK
ncbi:MAG TPA: hypothetical protein VK467_04515 [Gemmatimonadales bacterium]|nr:hypothetical protein [Gemmatimonadales bacterium]